MTRYVATKVDGTVIGPFLTYEEVMNFCNSMDGIWSIHTMEEPPKMVPHSWRQRMMWRCERCGDIQDGAVATFGPYPSGYCKSKA